MKTKLSSSRRTSSRKTSSLRTSSRKILRFDPLEERQLLAVDALGRALPDVPELVGVSRWVGMTSLNTVLTSRFVYSSCSTWFTTTPAVYPQKENSAVIVPLVFGDPSELDNENGSESGGRMKIVSGGSGGNGSCGSGGTFSSNAWPCVYGTPTTLVKSSTRIFPCDQKTCAFGRV